MNEQSIEIQRDLLQKAPIVNEHDIHLLSSMLQQAYEHPKDFFILQIGDCAESFEDDREDIIIQKCDFYTRMAVLLEERLRKEVILIGRIAGQYSKPRTADMEEQNGISLLSYRGDMINGFDFTPASRQEDSRRMLEAYQHSLNTINVINNYCTKRHSKKIFTSHEALVLEFESALTRISKDQTSLFNASAHSVWLGNRSRQLNGAHLDYLRTIHNPIGVKIGITETPSTLIALLMKLNPERKKGRICLITRFGAEMVYECLPKLIEAVNHEGFPVLWCSDPMHGNTFKMNNMCKVRATEDILLESLRTIEIHARFGTPLSGLHLESTFLPVTECVTGHREQAANHTFDSYLTKCDPRLNAEQTGSFLGRVAQFRLVSE